MESERSLLYAAPARTQKDAHVVGYGKNQSLYGMPSKDRRAQIDCDNFKSICLNL